MLGAGEYPITIAEMPSYMEDADDYFDPEEHERLKEFLALNPENGRVLADTGGVRVLQWPIKQSVKIPTARVLYYFRDLNMPIYLLALYKRGERIPLNSRWRDQLKALVVQLLAEHSRRWATMLSIDEGR